MSNVAKSRTSVDHQTHRGFDDSKNFWCHKSVDLGEQPPEVSGDLGELFGSSFLLLILLLLLLSSSHQKIFRFHHRPDARARLRTAQRPPKTGCQEHSGFPPPSNKFLSLITIYKARIPLNQRQTLLSFEKELVFKVEKKKKSLVNKICSIKHIGGENHKLIDLFQVIRRQSPQTTTRSSQPAHIIHVHSSSESFATVEKHKTHTRSRETRPGREKREKGDIAGIPFPPSNSALFQIGRPSCRRRRGGDDDDDEAAKRRHCATIRANLLS